MGMQSEIEFIGWEIGTHGNAVLSFTSLAGESELKSPDHRINTRFRASPKAFIFYGLLKTRRPY